MRQLIRNFARERRRSEFFWRYGFNFLPSLNYRFGAEKNSTEAVRGVIENLNRDGIAITSVSELLGTDKSFAELESEVQKMLEERGDEIEKLKIHANDADSVGDKTFNVELLGSQVNFEPDAVFARFALQDALLNLANNYFQMIVKLRYYNVWYTFATNSAARESQLWHYDREDNYILKVFLYLNDVDEGAGPFTYAPQTHPKGVLRGREPEYFLEKNVRRTTDEQMSAVVPKENWIKATGKKGTIVFADTRGYHKGGEARTSDRLMYTCMFTSPASESKRLLQFSNNLQTKELNKKQISALELT